MSVTTREKAWFCLGSQTGRQGHITVGLDERTSRNGMSQQFFGLKERERERELLISDRLNKQEDKVREE
jgi:hypothetical protein